MSIESWKKEYKNVENFNLLEWQNTWYEQIIPIDQIPDEFRVTKLLPNGRKQIIDDRIPGWTFKLDVASHDGKLGAFVVCPETASEEKNGS